LASVPAFQPQRFGNYVLTAHLGRGGMADVFRAQRVGAAGFERTCVVKRILKPYTDDRNFVEMFINEAKIAAQLSHPNIAQVYELGEIDGEYFIAMEYVKGMDLLHVLRWLAKNSVDRRWLPAEVAAYIAREVCRALGHAHDHMDEQRRPLPIVHRDVSPQNIMIGYDGQVKVIDFGIAKAMFSVSEITRSGTLKGKIAYMSPEQVRGESPGPESDIFAAGVVLYEMLIGRRLFKGENDFETLQRVQNMTVPPPSRVGTQVPEELDPIVMRALERDRGQRYKKATSMARDLDQWLQTVRFSIEHLSEYMTATFPPEARQEMPDAQGARTPSQAGYAGTPSQNAETSQSKLPGRLREQTNPSSPRARAISGTGSMMPARRNRALAFAGLGVGLVLFGVGAWLTLRPHAPPMPQIDVTSLPLEPEAARDLAVAHRQPVVEPIVPAPAPTPPVVAEPAPAPQPERRRPAPAPTHVAKPAQPGAKKPKIEVFDDAEQPAQKPKIETFDD
jgi:serine/threonine protein kinase